MSSLSLYVSVFSLLKNVSVTLERWGELRVLARRGYIVSGKKGGLQWLVNLEKLFSHFWLLLY